MTRLLMNKLVVISYIIFPYWFFDDAFKTKSCDAFKTSYAEVKEAH